MPEMPEVETIRNALDHALTGARIHSVDLHRESLRRPIPQALPDWLRDSVIRAIKRRGKFLLFDLNGTRDHILILHFGMSGHARIENDPPLRQHDPPLRQHDPPLRQHDPLLRKHDHPLRKHDHVVFHTSRGRLIYHDPRRFGQVDCIRKSALATYPPLVGMGYEPLSRQATAQRLYQALQGRSRNIKNLLMDQKIIAGLGNIYACEALFESRLAPTRQGRDLTIEECRRLNRAIRNILKKAIASGGSSLRDHIHPDGTPGYFQHAFSVYGRDGQDCRRCSAAILCQRMGGRSTFFCPSCQRDDTLPP